MTFNQDVNGGSLPHLGEGLSKLQHKWGWFVAFGALATILGFATLTYLVTVGTIASIYMIGFFILLAGVAEIALGFSARTWGWKIIWVLVGILYIAAGIIAFAYPMDAAVGITLVLGAALVAVGIVRLFAAFQLSAHKGLLIFSAAITILLGVMILAGWPNSSAYTLGIFLGVDLLFYGISWIFFGFQLKNA